ncbi:MAG: hypothetical protein OXN90_04945, partial [Gemmatimonadota bacterium]|nr:hypothetical protein [Gemmatimonadota bacterium]
MLRYSKLLLRRLAYVPWLLAVGLVLGGAEEAVAQQIYVLPASEAEGSDVVFTVSMTQASTQAVRVNYTVTVEPGDTATLATDFTAVPGVLTIAADGTSGTISVATEDDDIDEDDETFTLRLLSVSSGTILVASAKGTITDGDPLPTVSVADQTASEADGTMDFAVTLSAVSGRDVEVTYATSVGSGASGAVQADFLKAEETLTIAAGAATATISVAIIDDSADEDDETFTLTLLADPAPKNAALGTETATGTIEDNDNPPLVNVADARATEGNFMNFMVTLSAASGKSVTVTYATLSGTATMDADFAATSGVLTIAVGAATATISVPIINEGNTEPEETFTLLLSAPLANVTLGRAAATGRITSQFPSVSGAAEPVVEGSPVVFTVTLSAASTQRVEVTYVTTSGTATSGTDFTASSDV